MRDDVGNLFERAGIDYDTLVTANPAAAMIASRMLINGRRRAARRYSARHIEEAAPKKKIKVVRGKKPVPKTAAKKPVVRVNKLPKVKVKRANTPSTIDQAKKASDRASKFKFRMPPRVVIEDKYSFLFAASKTNKRVTSHDKIYAGIKHATHLLGHIVTSGDFHLANAGGDRKSDFDDYETWDGEDNTKSINDESHYLRVQPKHVESDLANRLDIPLSFYIPRTDSENDERDEGYRGIVRILRTLFPEFPPLDKFTTVKLKDMDEGEAAKLGITLYGSDKSIPIFSGHKPIRKSYKLSELMNMKFTYKHFDGALWKKANGPNNITLPDELAKRWSDSQRKLYSNMIRFDLTLLPDPERHALINARASGNMESGRAGTASNNNMVAGFTLKVDVFIEWPKELAYYFVSADNDEEFLPSLFLRYILLHKKYSARTQRGAVKPPARIQPLGKIKQEVQKEAKLRKFIPRTNKEGFTLIGPSQQGLMGQVVWVPEKVDNVDKYTQLYRNAYNVDTNEVEFQKEDVIKNEPLFTDWANGIFTYANATENFFESGIETINLTGSIPLDEVTIGRDLETRGTASPAFASLVAAMRKMIDQIQYGDIFINMKKRAPDERLTQISSRALRPASTITASGKYIDHKLEIRAGSLTQLSQDVTETLRENMITTFGQAAALLDRYILTWAELGYGEKDWEEDRLRPGKPSLKQACQAFFLAVCERTIKHFNELDVSFKEKCESLRYRLILLTQYSKKSKYYRQKFAQTVSTNTMSNVDMKKIPKIYNMPGLEIILPHQRETSNALEQENQESATLGIAAGGGKTIIQLIDYMNLLANNKTRFAVMIPPNNLMDVWVNECIELGRGEINVVPLSRETIEFLEDMYTEKPYGKRGRPDYESLGRYILSCPPNTLFVLSMTFLRTGLEYIAYGDEIIERLPTAEFLRDLFLMNGGYACGIDESHFVKKAETARTKAVAILSSMAKIKRQLSGTRIFNRPDDEVGQMALINPMALGSQTNFDKRYKDSANKFKDEAYDQMEEDIVPYAMRVIHQRRRWAAWTPNLIEEFHPIDMTENQKIFYTAFLKKEIERLKAEVKLKKKSGEEDELPDSAVQAQLAKVESFIYAPDAHKLAQKYPLATTGLKSKDEIPFKYAAQVSFSKLSTTTLKDLVSPKVKEIDRIITEHLKSGMAGKIIVFGEKKINTLHAFEHTTHKDISIHYSVDKKEQLNRFLYDPKIKVMFANERSINTGKNFQIASRLIRVETLWTPGGQEQAIARIWRPDFKDRNLSKRPTVYMDWIYTISSFEVLKIARLISKIISSKRAQEARNKEFTKKAMGDVPAHIAEYIRSKYRVNFDETLSLKQNLDNLPELRLSLKNLKEFGMNPDGTPNPGKAEYELARYFGNYALLNTWDDKQYEKEKNDPNNIPTIIPEKSRGTIKGSKPLLFMPRIPGQKPLDPKDKYGFAPISVLEAKENVGDDEEENEDDADVVDVEQIEVGTLVDTQWGFGRITSIHDKMVRVAVPGFLYPVKSHKACTYVLGARRDPDISPKQQAANIERYKKSILEVKMSMKKKQVQPRFPVGVDPQFALRKGSGDYKAADYKNMEIPKYNPMQVTEDDAVSEGEEGETPAPQRTRMGKEKIDVRDKDTKVDIGVFTIDRQVALAAFEEDSDAEVLGQRYGFKKVDQCYLVMIENIRAFDKVIERLEGRYSVKDEFIEGLKPFRDAMRKDRLEFFNPEKYAEVQQFIRKSKFVKLKENVLRPYPMVWNDTLFLAFDKAAQPSAKTLKQRLSGIPGCDVALQDTTYVRLFRSATEAQRILDQIMDDVVVTSYSRCRKDLAKMKLVRS